MPDTPFPEEVVDQAKLNFREQGEQIGVGLTEPVSLSRVGRMLLSVGEALIANFLYIVMSSAGAIAVFFARAMARGEDKADPIFRELARVGLEDLTGFKQSDGPAAIGKQFMEAFTGGAGAAPGGQIAPSSAGAEAYMEMVTKLTLEGWFQSSFLQLVTLGYGEKFGELDDAINNSLGLGRMSRRVLAPLLNTRVVTPMQWLVNQQYRPELLSAAATVEAFLSGQYTAAQLSEELSRQGYSDERINILVNNARRRLSFADLVEQHYHGALSESEVIARAGELAYDAVTAAELLALQNVRRRDKWNDPIVETAIAAFLNDEISEGDCLQAVRGAAPSHAEGETRVSVAKVQKGLRRHHLSASDERRLVFKEIRSVADYRRALARENYTPEAITALELELRFDLDARHDLASAKAEAEAERAREEAEREAAAAARQAAVAARQALPTLSEYTRAYVRGLIDRPAFAAAIAREKVAITPADLALLLADADATRAAALEREAKAEAARLAREIPGLSLAQLEAAVIAGVLSLADYDAAVATAKFPDDERRILTALLADRLEDRAEAARQRTAAAARADVKRISLPDFERAVRLGLRTREAYAALLEALETPEIARALLLDLLDSQIAEDAATRATRAARDPVAKAAGLSLAQRRRAVLAGVLPRSEYEASLFAAQWPAEDVALELALVDLERAEAEAARRRRAEIAAEEEQRQQQAAADRLARVERDAAAAIATAEREAQAAAARADRDAQDAAERAAREARALAEAEARAAREQLPPTLSLSQMERAVVLGLLPPGALAEDLTARGYTAADVDTIVNLALARIPDTREAARLEQTVTRELAEKGIAFADLKLAARRGLITPGDYAGELAARGYGADAIALLRQLLEEQIAIDAAGLRAKTAKTVEAVEGAPPLDAIEEAFATGELDVGGVRDVLLSFGVPADTALVFARLLLTRGAEA